MFGVVLAFVAVLGSPPTHQEFREFFALEEPTVERLTPQAEMRLLDEIARDIEEREERRLEVLLEKQEALAELGWYEGEVDGIRGPLTERAIDRFVAAADLEDDPEVVLAALSEEDAPEAPPPPPAPAPKSSPASSSGGIAAHWIRLAECESGNWINGGASFERGSARWQWAKPGVSVPPWGTHIHHGGLQFSPSTWNWVAPMVGLGHIDYAYNATPHEQVRVAEKVRELQGWGAWPICSRKVGLR